MRIAWLRGLAAGLALALALGGCEGDPAGPGVPDPGGDFAVAVGPGTTPAYSWSAGAAFSVRVARAAAATTPVWSVTTPGVDGIASPLAHGTVPSGAVESFATERTLTTGVAYRVTVTRLDGTFGRVEFTP